MVDDSSFTGARVTLAVRSTLASIVLSDDTLAGSLVLILHRRCNTEHKCLICCSLAGKSQVRVHFATVTTNLKQVRIRLKQTEIVQIANNFRKLFLKPKFGISNRRSRNSEKSNNRYKKKRKKTRINRSKYLFKK